MPDNVSPVSRPRVGPSSTRPLTTPDNPAPDNPGVDWRNLLFLLGLHTVGAGGLWVYLRHRPPSVFIVALVVVGFILTTFGISAGYHRLFAHRSYTTGNGLKALLLLLGASAIQNSALTWATKHRSHHQHTDTERDPYNARRGFWYSHIGWVVTADKEDSCDTRDLTADRLVALQHRWYLPAAMLLGFGVPTLIGWVVGDAAGGFLFGGVWRLLLSYHATFSINSIAHWIGSQPYSTKGTARDNLLAAIVTMGEGYHNFHHTFPGDYRNGVRFFDFDPPKWVLASFAYLGWIEHVRRTPGHVIALRRLKTARQHLEHKAALLPTEREVMAARADKLKLLLAQWSKAYVSRSSRSAKPPFQSASGFFSSRESQSVSETHARGESTPVALSRRAFWKAFNDWESEVKS